MIKEITNSWGKEFISSELAKVVREKSDRSVCSTIQEVWVSRFVKSEKGGKVVMTKFRVLVRESVFKRS